MPPRLADQDLRGLLYVSREYAPLITPEDRLSSDSAEVLQALLEHPDMAHSIVPKLVAMPKAETAIIMDRLLDRARQEEEWGVPDILEACLAVSEADPSQGARLGAFLSGLPHAQIKPSIVPKIADQPWAARPLEKWQSSTDIHRTVKNAINRI